jgi:hypothetical protein
MLRFTRSRISTGTGAARMLRLPRALGPNSDPPCIHPTMWPLASTSATPLDQRAGPRSGRSTGPSSTATAPAPHRPPPAPSRDGRARHDLAVRIRCDQPRARTQRAAASPGAEGMKTRLEPGLTEDPGVRAAVERHAPPSKGPCSPSPVEASRPGAPSPPPDLLDAGCDVGESLPLRMAQVDGGLPGPAPARTRRETRGERAGRGGVELEMVEVEPERSVRRGRMSLRTWASNDGSPYAARPITLYSPRSRGSRGRR